MAYGIDYSNFPSPYYNQGNEDNEYGEANLNPYVSIYGLDIYENPPSSTGNRNSIHRFVLNVAPLDNETYPHSGNAISLVNLDTIQLYIKKSGDYKFGSDYEPPEENQDADSCLDKYPSDYDSAPIPIKGAPIEFRKVFFQGIPRSKEGASLECEEETSFVGNYYAYFACSKPIKQDCGPSQSAGCTYNPRNEYFNFIDGEVSDWESFDVGGGSGSSEVCNFLFEKFDENSNSFKIRSLGGTINGLIPSNTLDIGTFSSNQNYFVTLVADVDVSGITALRYEVDTNLPSISPQYNNATPPPQFKIFAFMCIEGEITSSLCKSLQASPEVAYLDQSKDPYENVCTWSIKTIA